jgi:hypothetical protein
MSTKDLQDIINKNRAELDAARTELKNRTLNLQEHRLRELKAALYEAKRAAGIPVATAATDTGNIRVYQRDFDLFTKVLTDVYRNVSDYRATPFLPGKHTGRTRDGIQYCPSPSQHPDSHRRVDTNHDVHHGRVNDRPRHYHGGHAPGAPIHGVHNTNVNRTPFHNHPNRTTPNNHPNPIFPSHINNYRTF